jgi:hypothetical protein
MIKMQKTETRAQYVLDEKTVRTLVLLKNYLDDILETLDVMGNPKTMKKYLKLRKN